MIYLETEPYRQEGRSKSYRVYGDTSADLREALVHLGQPFEIFYPGEPNEYGQVSATNRTKLLKRHDCQELENDRAKVKLFRKKRAGAFGVTREELEEIDPPNPEYPEELEDSWDVTLYPEDFENTSTDEPDKAE